ncbi:MAG: hypothetical protein QOI66_2904 [Myxococcales bacterium]|nr:hypothetical protein [Myxococcales bacterium]
MAVKASSLPGMKSGASTKRSPTFEEIAARSYQLYLARGREEGHEVEDWLAAEAQLGAEAG